MSFEINTIINYYFLRIYSILGLVELLQIFAVEVQLYATNRLEDCLYKKLTKCYIIEFIQ